MPLPLSLAFGIPIQHHESKRRFCAAPLTGDFPNVHPDFWGQDFGKVKSPHVLRGPFLIHNHFAALNPVGERIPIARRHPCGCPGHNRKKARALRGPFLIQ